MTKLHPLFEEIVKPMAYLNEAPDRALQPTHEVAQPGFDPWDDALMHDLCGKRLGPVVANLLIALDQIDMTKDSFGVDAERAVKFLHPLLVDLKKAVIEDWADQ